MSLSIVNLLYLSVSQVLVVIFVIHFRGLVDKSKIWIIESDTRKRNLTTKGSIKIKNRTNNNFINITQFNSEPIFSLMATQQPTEPDITPRDHSNKTLDKHFGLNDQ